SLRIAVTPTFTTYLVGPLIEAFHSRHPKITVNLKEISQERIEELLLAGELDVGIAFDEINTPDIEAIPLLNETLALVVNRKHRLAE
ncbi:LysR substrate-binding domain-containing protein, partial [Pseudomonas syringae]|uniref:LysR substrate-binding domain-containing protein n=2 Tax=Pseudomonas TaxID=286 RepID=UPI0034D6E492